MYNIRLETGFMFYSIKENKKKRPTRQINSRKKCVKLISRTKKGQITTFSCVTKKWTKLDKNCRAEYSEVIAA